MSRRRFRKVECPICKRIISKNARAYKSHMAAHVRAGEAEPINRFGGVVQLSSPFITGYRPIRGLLQND